MSKNKKGPFQPKQWVLLLTIVAPVLGVVWLMVAAGADQVAHPPVIAKLHQVDVISVELRDHYLQQRDAIGRVETNKIASVGFELSGNLLSTAVDEGEQVAQGQILASLDTQRLDANMQELEAALRRAKADAKLAQLSEQRVVDLVAKKLESAQRLDEVRQSAIAANEVVSEIEARQRSVKVELKKSKIRAPFAGTIMSRPVDPGTVVAAGQVIYTLQQLDSLEVRFALSADDAYSLQPYVSYQLGHGSNKVQAILKSVVPRRRMDTRTIDVLFSLTATDERLLPGDLLTLSFTRNVAASGSWIPRQALNNGQRGLWMLFSVEDSDDGQQRISSKTVQVLYTNNDYAYIDGAIQNGDLLVVNGAQRLVPNQLVKANIRNDLKLVKR